MSEERYALAHVLVYFDAAVTNGLQHFLPAAAGPVLQVASLLGGTPGWVLLIGFSFWWSGSRLGVRVALITSASALFNVFAKWTLRQPRPYFLSSGISPLEASDGFGMPSGHAQGSATAWSAVARWSRSRRLAWLGIAMTLLAGLARVYFGVHSTLQVLLGWALGVTAVVVAARFEPKLARWWATATPLVRWIAAVAPALALLGLGLLLRVWLLSHWAVPVEWVARHQAAAAELGTAGALDDAAGAELRLFDVSFLARWTGALLGASLVAAWWAVPGRAPLVVRSWSERVVQTAIGCASGVVVLQLGGMALAAVGEMGEFARFAILLWVIAVVAPRFAQWSCSRLAIAGDSKS